MEKLQEQLKEIDQWIHTADLKNDKVSKVGTYWHLDHMLRVINGIPQALENSQPEDYNPKWTFLKWAIMTFKKMPRGKGKAPQHVLPEENISQTDLESKLVAAQEGLEKTKHLNKNAHFKHPLFGDMNVKKSLKFLWIHTEHHLKIVRDIKNK